ncbi:sirohydrochlorin cobaltochelatase [uncultured Cetobacterium sp.]|uniref:sirohydrochlorin cobaltochelatase n=1 Tax=uncultured Cetobacterium sp. TaxID=527638 RepID=UPI00260E02E2|nr:sirohydrochlorin cobaltochelatase [uncultured Cetobacterium sp.]
MKKLFVSLFCLTTVLSFAHGAESYVDSEFYNGGKSAVIMAHFGTTHDDTRAKTIDVINQKAAKAFKGNADVFEVYTSRIINKKLHDKENINKMNTTEMLKALKKQGYENIIIQSTNVIDGVEMDAIKKEAQEFSKDFKELRVGEVLLNNPHDYEDTIKIIKKNIGKLKKNEGIVLVGHGSYDSGNSAYAMFDYMAKDMNEPMYVGTVEGYPTFDTVNRQLKKDKIKEVVLMPMMFVAGDHAKNDIAGDWKDMLEKAGYKVNVKLLPLGEMPEIQNKFINDAKFLEKHKEIDILAKKRGYTKGEEGHSH